MERKIILPGNLLNKKRRDKRNAIKKIRRWLFMYNRLTKILHELHVIEVSPTATNGKVSRSVSWVILTQMESVLETVCLHNHITKQVLCVHLETVLYYSAAMIAVFVHQKYFHSRNNHGCLRSY